MGTVASQSRWVNPVAPKPLGLRPFRVVVLILVVGAVGLQACQPAGQPRGPSASPSAGAVGQAPSRTPSGALTPVASTSTSTSPTPSPTTADDSVTALSTARRYETARAAGSWQTAWSLLSTYSQSMTGSLAHYEQLEKAYNQSGGTRFQLQDPTQDPALLSAEFLGQAYVDARSNADIVRAWLVFVKHPDVRGASAGTTGLLLAPIDDRWYVWIAH